MAKKINVVENKAYWQNRAETNYINGEKSALQVLRNLKNLYKRSYNEIEDKINAFYGKYANEAGLTLEEAKQVLNRQEAKAFKDYIEDLLKYGNKHDFSPSELTEYRRLYNKAKITRLEKLQANIREELDKLTVKSDSQIEELLQDNYEDNYYKTIYDTQIGIGVDNAFTGLNKKAINEAVNEKYQKSNFSDRLWTNTDKLMQTLTMEIPRGIVLGYNPRKLAREVSKKLDTNYNNTVRLIRTEYGHIMNKSTLDGYRQAGIKQYKISTALDSRRCDDCGDYEGTIVDVSDAIEGINLPPFHPNCRCTTIPYFEKDYIDDMTDEELDNIGFVTYEDWKNGLVKLKDGKVVYRGLEKQTINKVKLNLSDFPTEFSSKSFEKDTTDIINYVNNQANVNPDVVNLYKNLGKNTVVPFTLHRSKNENRLIISANTFTQEIKQVDLMLPKLNMKSNSSISTWLHETAHFIDFTKNNKTNTYKGYYSSKNKSLIYLLSKRDLSISDEISKMFKNFNEEYSNTYLSVNKEYNPRFKELNDNYRKGLYSSYKDYKKEWNNTMKELRNAREEAVDVITNKYSGVEVLQDMYDALSGGLHLSSKNVIAGHGQSYYSAIHRRAEELFANYCALSITSPNLIAMLQKDKPELTKALDNMIKEMNK